jgi:molybdopterin/thiamine biosynthesis adenylyltransferase
VARLLAGLDDPPELFLVDGDVIEDHNCERQFFKGVVGKAKAQALADVISPKFPEVPIVPVISYINNDSMRLHRNRWLREPVIVLSGVDNNATRCIVEDELVRLKNSILISGGNEVTDGQVHIFARRNRKNLTPTPSQIAPEVREYTDVAPGTEGHCLEKGASDPQTALINRTISVVMEMSLGYFIAGGDIRIIKPPFNEIKADTEEGFVKGFWRDPVPGLENKTTWSRRK